MCEFRFFTTLESVAPDIDNNRKSRIVHDIISASQMASQDCLLEISLLRGSAMYQYHSKISRSIEKLFSSLRLPTRTKPEKVNLGSTHWDKLNPLGFSILFYFGKSTLNGFLTAFAAFQNELLVEIVTSLSFVSQFIINRIIWKWSRLSFLKAAQAWKKQHTYAKSRIRPNLTPH